MKKTHNFRELKVWQVAMDLAMEVFTMLEEFPKEERFGLVSQISRSSISIPSNIAEGSSRESIKDFKRYLSIALGSSFELETQVLLARSFNYIPENQEKEFIDRLHELQRMMVGLKKSLTTNDTEDRSNV